MAGKSARESPGQLASLSSERVLQKIGEVARDVVQVKYAALGVINESGTKLSQLPVPVLPEVLALHTKDISRTKPAVRASGLLDRCRA